jgi:arginine/lysine/ornithine decarboxylase
VALPLSRAAGRVSCDIITIYPPGIPILVPGEEITPEAVDYLLFLGGHGARIDGVQDAPAGGRDDAWGEPAIRVLDA